MGIQNLRNKYSEHPVIRPLIDYCDDNDMGFEFIKETRLVGPGFKSFKYVNTYYMKIGESLIEAESDLWFWDDLFKLIVKAYSHLGIQYPDNLIKVAKAFKRQI